MGRYLQFELANKYCGYIQADTLPSTGRENSQDGVTQVILPDIIVGNLSNINLGWYFCSELLNNKTSA